MTRGAEVEHPSLLMICNSWQIGKLEFGRGDWGGHASSKLYQLRKGPAAGKQGAQPGIQELTNLLILRSSLGVGVF